MKKTLILLLSVVMVLTFALAACGGGGEDLSDSKYVGTWKAESMSLGEDSEAFDGEYLLTLNGDGTGTFSGEDDVNEFTWHLTSDGFKTKGDTKLKFKDEGDGIVTTLIGVELHFSKVDGGEAGDVVDLVDGKAYGYGGDDPVEAACYEYLVKTVSKDYDAADVSIPYVNIVYVDYTGENEILAKGDFWIWNYNIDGDTLKTASGGAYPGVMHISKDGYAVTAFDVVADGEGFDESAKELFGEHYDDFMAVYGDDTTREKNRKYTIGAYVNYNGLDVTKYQDEGWDPVDLILQ